MTVLADRVAAGLAARLPDDVAEAARQLGESAGGAAVLFYGSVLRTGRLDELLDFYVLTDDPRGPLIWPRISFRTIGVGSRTLRAKVATMPMSLFAKAARGGLTDTTIWTRFCQPTALAWTRDPAVARSACDAVAAAIVTAARYAAALGPEEATAEAFWTALFDRTYEAELRVEAPGRSASIVGHAPAHFAQLLPLAWVEAGIGYTHDGAVLRPRIEDHQRRAMSRGWRRRARLGRPLNALRLVKAAFTLREAGSYALWKIERHVGVHIKPTRWRRQHPLLATPGVLWQVYRARRRTAAPGPPSSQS